MDFCNCPYHHGHIALRKSNRPLDASYTLGQLCTLFSPLCHKISATTLEERFRGCRSLVLFLYQYLSVLYAVPISLPKQHVYLPHGSLPFYIFFPGCTPDPEQMPCSTSFLSFLPVVYIQWGVISSPDGRKIFREALLEGHMEMYFRLAEQFRTQDDPAFCGLSTLTMVLNALAVDPGRVWKGENLWQSL